MNFAQLYNALTLGTLTGTALSFLLFSVFTLAGFGDRHWLGELAILFPTTLILGSFLIGSDLVHSLRSKSTFLYVRGTIFLNKNRLVLKQSYKNHVIRKGMLCGALFVIGLSLFLLFHS